MSMTDPVSDLLTRIRNGNSNGQKTVKVPYSDLKKNILRVLKEQGYITDYFPEMEGAAEKKGRKGILRIELKYGPDGEKVIRFIRRVSKPGRRIYKGVTALPKVLDGLGIAVLSTPRGVISNIEAKKLGVGGEILCEVW
jgi:small subunit ribosomal protein S8